MSERKKNEIIAELNEKLSTLKDRQTKLETEVRESADKRDRLNGRVKVLRDEVMDLRTQRDEVNSKVRELKQRRNEMTAKIHEMLEEIRTLQEKSKGPAKRKPPISREALQKEVESIDWKIQTTPLTLKEDKELVQRVKQLETQLAIYRKLEQLAARITHLRTEVRTRQSESELLHRQLTENAQKSQETHVKMVAKIEESKSLRKEADDMHRKFLQVKERKKPLQEEAKIVLDQIRRLKGEIREELQKEKEESQDALRETLEKKAKEKLKRGEKLSWEEFQLVAEKGMTEED